ncbi:MAG: transposase [Planctomycetota bacterium]
MREKAKQATFGFTDWGGKRKGAGRKPKGERALVTHRPRPKLKHYTPALVTLRLCANLPSLRDDGVLAVVKDARLKSAREDFRIVHFSIQTNHLHLIVEAQDNAVLARGMKSFAVRLAKLLNREWRRKGRVFVDRYHLQVLGTPQQVRNALVYTLNNARKHNSWKPKRPDPYSSGVDFAHWLEPRAEWDKEKSAQSSSTPKRPKRRPGMSSIEWSELSNGYTKENQQRVREQGLLLARTWLLREGWRRHGSIGLMETPVERPLRRTALRAAR